MLQIIKIKISNEEYKIEWALSEYFEELKGKKFMLSQVSAEQIKRINDLSLTAKILLSAVAGAVIQYLIDNGVKFDLIFSEGNFEIV